MKYLGSAGLLLAVLACLGCKPNQTSQGHHAESAAKQSHPIEEQALNTLVLTPQAERRLGIRTVEVRLDEVSRKLTVGGQIMVPPGRTITVWAPMAGLLSLPDGIPLPAPGASVSSGQAMLSLIPVLSPERDVLTPAEQVGVARTRADLAAAQVTAERDVAEAKVQLEAARIVHDRTVQLLGDGAGSQRSVDETAAQVKLAEELIESAEARYEALASVQLSSEAGSLETRLVPSPVDGIVDSIEVAPGETVQAGQPLFRIVQLEKVWIRVPVYTGHRQAVDRASPAEIRLYGTPAATEPLLATPAAAPPTADPIACTVDFYYELGNGDLVFTPGQRVSVTMRLQEQSPALVAPWASVVFDHHGGEWVYEQTEPQTYVRRRVAVRYVDGPDAVLAEGPDRGAKLVTDGAAELFGTEFGGGK